MRKVLSFVLVLAMILGSVSMAFATSFSDTTGKSYAEEASLLSDLGVINGYADGTFGGDKNITRAEYVAMMVRALGYDVTGTAATGFKDVANDYWASAAIKYAKDLGITLGYTDGTFRPTANVTLDEAIAFTVRALGYKDEYLVGSYPANCINQAMNLGMLNGVKTGSVAATRGEIAQLVYNTLGQKVVSYFDKDGMPVFENATTLLTRLGAKQDVNADGTAKYVVVTEAIMDKCADGFSLASYVGQYVNLYMGTKGASKDKYIGVYEVKGTVLTGTFSTKDGKNYFTADDVKYTINPSATGFYATAQAQAAVDKAVTYVNGGTFGEAAYTTFDFTGATTYTVAAKVDGLQLADIYSIGLWTPSHEFSFDDGDFKAAKYTLDGYDFQATTSNKIDTTSFTLLGVDALENIKEDDIVTLYTARVNDGTYITKVEVSNKTVEGVVDKISSDGKTFTIGGTAYKFSNGNGSTLEATASRPAVKDEGTFYLNYAGKIFDYEATTKAQYAIVLDAGNANGTGLNAVAAKVKLFLADGTVATYDAPTATAEINGTTVAAIEGSLAAGDLVSYTLTTKGKIAEIDTVGTVAGTKITKQSTINGTLISDKAVLFAYYGGDLDDEDNYGVVTLDSVLDATIGAASVFVKDTTTGTYKAGLIVTPSTSTTDYVVFNDYAKINDATYAYEIYVLDGTGETVTYKTNVDVETTPVDVTKIYAVKTDANGAFSSLDGTAATTSAAIAAAADANVKNGNRVVVANGVEFTVASNVVVYVWNADDEEFEFKSVSDLKEYVGNIYFFDTNTTPDKVYDIVIAK